jgi:fructose-1,6-bisphosphatase
MRDKIIQQVIAKIKNRSDVGFKKYKVTLNDDNQSLDIWLNHLQEELMDAVNYIEKARSVLREEIEECYIKDLKAKDSESISLYPETEYWTTNHSNEV